MRFLNRFVQMLLVCGMVYGAASGCAGVTSPQPLTPEPGQSATPTASDGGNLQIAENCTGYSQLADRLMLTELGATHSEAQIAQLLDAHDQTLPAGQRAAAATLVLVGLVSADELTCDQDQRAALLTRLDAESHALSEAPATLLGRVGDLSLFAALTRKLDYAALTEPSALQTSLGQLLARGVITGYDLRTRGVYDQFPAGHTFIYSHADDVHLRQLVALLAREGVQAWVHRTPKVSAFAYRDGWGGDGAHVVTLPGGARVIQGREFAVLFHFPSAQERARFHTVVSRYAKRNSKEQTGLIRGAWWQPFYYTDEALTGFASIELLVVASGAREATLTVPTSRADAVQEALLALGVSVARKTIWVNPAFFRFLNGDFK